MEERKREFRAPNGVEVKTKHYKITQFQLLILQ